MAAPTFAASCAAASEEVLLSTTDLAAVDVKACLCVPASQPAILDTLKAAVGDGWPNLLFTPRLDLKAEDLILSELLSARGPAAWLATSDGDAGWALASLAAGCRRRWAVLVLRGRQGVDLVLLAREVCGEDGVPFALFATQVEGVAFTSRTIAERRVAVVLDLDSTLLESEHLPGQPDEWVGLDWRQVPLPPLPCGTALTGQVCALPSEWHRAEAVYAASYACGGKSWFFRVRQRKGWAALRDRLTRECVPGGKLSVHVLSGGLPPYIQVMWHLLDPQGLLIHHSELGTRLNSARRTGECAPRTCPMAPKTHCMAAGLRTALQPDCGLCLGPMWCVDDEPAFYSHAYLNSVYALEPYSPVDSPDRQYDPDGSVLRRLGTRLLTYWHHCYGGDGGGNAVAQLEAEARRTLRKLCAVPRDGLQPGAAAAWAPSLFRERPAVAALSLHVFLVQAAAAKMHQRASPRGKGGVVADCEAQKSRKRERDAA